MSTLTQLKATADIIGGSVFFANEQGFDPEYPNNGDLLPDGMYIRLEGSDGSVAYISAYEMDKALDIIGQMSMGKANQADVDAIIAELNKKTSNVEFELLASEVENKASKAEVEDLVTEVNLKADKSVVDALAETVNTKASKAEVEDLVTEVNLKADKSVVDALAETVNTIDVDPKEIENLKKDISSLKETLETITDVNSINVIKNQIAYLSTELNKRLTQNDLKSINTNISNITDDVNDINGKLESIEVNLNKKATQTYVQGQVAELNGAITGISSRLDAKADKVDVATKANKTDVESLTKKVTQLNTTVSTTLSDIDNSYKEISAEIETKADKETLNTALDNIENAIDAKADKGYIDESISEINTKVKSLKEGQEENYNIFTNSISELECEVNNSLAELKSNVNSQSRQIATQASQISKLQETDVKYAEKLKTEWVRVMTPEQYKQLAPVGNTYSDGTPNPYAKQPNVIYMLVRYNKPIAVYIGDVLIAQAEQKGSIGFAYSFPIIFQ